MSVDPEFARWLREGAYYEPVTDAAIAALWAELARVTEVMSPLATKGAAAAEASRQLAFLGGPLALDQHLIEGSRADLIGRPVTLKIDRLGYDAGVSCFVVKVEEAAAAALTVLWVLRKLS